MTRWLIVTYILIGCAMILIASYELGAGASVLLYGSQELAGLVFVVSGARALRRRALRSRDAGDGP